MNEPMTLYTIKCKLLYKKENTTVYKTLRYGNKDTSSGYYVKLRQERPLHANKSARIIINMNLIRAYIMFQYFGKLPSNLYLCAIESKKRGWSCLCKSMYAQLLLLMGVSFHGES